MEEKQIENENEKQDILKKLKDLNKDKKDNDMQMKFKEAMLKKLKE